MKHLTKKMLSPPKPLWNPRSVRRPRRQRRPRRPTLRFSPYAWAKLLFLRDLGPTEVGGFGISPPGDLLSVQDLQLIDQHCTEAFVAFDDEAVAEFFDDQFDRGRQPEQCGRIWIHTHPGTCPQPSGTDHETFERVFGGCNWAVMFIMARSGKTHAELHWKAGGPARIPLRVEVDYALPFPGSDHPAWSTEYTAKVHPESWPLVTQSCLEPVLHADPDLDADAADLFAAWPGDDFQESAR